MKSKKINIVLLGTPEFAVPIFEELIKTFNVLLVISQPDKPSKRGLKVQDTPTKLLAQKYNIDCLQPQKIIEIYGILKELEIDFMITASYGQIIPKKVLDLAKFPLNVHGSILPKYRGAAPIQHAILQGEKVSGFCLMQMVEQMDAGPVFGCKEVNIEDKNYSEVVELLAHEAKKIVPNWIQEIFEGRMESHPQPEEGITFASKINKEDCEVFQTDSIEVVERKILAFGYTPGAYIFLENDPTQRIKLFRSLRHKVKGALEIEFANGTLWFTQFQRPGKKIIKVAP